MPNRIYAVRKRSGQWTVWSDQELCLNFESYHEALETARTAAFVLARPARDLRNDSLRAEARWPATAAALPSS
jgi:hypothetical protein